MLVAILGGGDWYDASVDHLVVPDGIKLDEQYKLYQAWYNDVYRPSLKKDVGAIFGIRTGDVEYMSFEGWLIDKCGARGATESDITIFSDGP